jgi:hypothetical protein
MNAEPVSITLNSPPDGVPAHGPVETVVQELPFGELTWENFERLCNRLAGNADQIEDYARYGRPGQGQQGIDIYARKRNGKYDVWQAKRYESFSASELTKAVDAFMEGEWRDKTECLYLAVQASLNDVKVQNEAETQAVRLRAEGITFIPLGGDKLSERLREHPAIVLDFFGREWAKAFFGNSVDPAILQCMDGAEFSRVRTQLRKVYQNQFQVLDRGIVEPLSSILDRDLTPTLGLTKRFTHPDVLIREIRPVHTSSISQIDASSPPQTELKDGNMQQGDERVASTRRVAQLRRISLGSWLAEGDQLALVGDAGAGKSTILRCLALDILGDQVIFSNKATEWGKLLPLLVPFSKWVRQTEATSGQVGLKEIVKATLQPLLTANLTGLLDRAIDEGRILLLVDGLDEWSNEQAARTALQGLLTFIGAHQVPTVITARPRGLDQIGAIPQDWASAIVAPLSLAQQRELASKWFVRHISDQPESDLSTSASVNRETERFFRELRQGRGLSALAETPLLLVGLIALSLRRMTLPRNRTQALQQIIEILVEVHPQSRATAADDVQSRFQFIPDSDVRLGALAAVAFTSRSEGGDAGLPISRAKEVIRNYLTDQETHGFPRDTAVSAANELLAVNAETVGLLIEKGPSEVGFAHACLDEYLSAMHVQNLPLDQVIEFTKKNCSNQRWRNVIAILIAITTRSTEIDQIVKAIETTESDVLGTINRRFLLADAAFGSSKISSATARRLAQDSIVLIEGGGWSSERSTLLASALSGINDPTLCDLVIEKFAIWAPRKNDYPESFFQVIERWASAPDVLYVLKRGLFDENRSAQRSAGRALAHMYKGDEDVGKWLYGICSGEIDPLSVSIAIETLAIGWPSIDGLDVIISEARSSAHPSLRLTAFFVRVLNGCHNEQDLAGLLDLLKDLSELDYWDRSFAASVLCEGWLDHPVVIKRCFDSVRRDRSVRTPHIELDAAAHYLLRCATNNTDIKNWILDELEQAYPFNLGARGIWDQILRFAEADNAIRERVIQKIINDEMQHAEWEISVLLERLQDERLKQFAMKNVQTAQGFSLYWLLKPLIHGWASDDAEVKQLLTEILHWNNDRLINIISLLPHMLPDHDLCRARLLTLAKEDQNARHDLLVSAFAQIGCNASDKEVVDVLLAKATSSNAHLFNGIGEMIENFSANERVREFTLNILDQRSVPVAAIASAYEKDDEIRRKLLRQLAPLPTSLRYLVVETASIEDDRHIGTRHLLEQYDCETDTDLKVTMAIRNYEQVKYSAQDWTVAVERLLDDCRAVGPDLEERRAAAFAGIVTLKATSRFAPLMDYNKPISISIGRSHGGQSQALLQLIIDHWDEISTELGPDPSSRIGRIGGSSSQAWEALAPYVSRNEAARRDFVSYCENISNPIGSRILKALARERPKSDLLERRCWSALDSTTNPTHLSPLDSERLAIEAAYLLHDHFGGQTETSERLHERVLSRPSDVYAIAFALYNPRHEFFSNLKIRPLEIGQIYGKWNVAIHIGAETQPACDFIEILCAMINRNLHSIWIFQDWINIAVQARLARDQEAAVLVHKVLNSKPSPNEIASLPRYLASAGVLDAEAYDSCRVLLDHYYRKPGVPLVGFDALANEVRPVAFSLLDALSGLLGF